MRILIAHNRYQQPGAEDQVFTAEADLLADRGHEVIRYELHNNSIKSTGRLKLARNTIWNPQSAESVQLLVRYNQVEVAHFHNTFPVMSPSVYRAARDEGAAVVQTLHNFRLVCPGNTMFRDNHLCDDCVGKPLPWPSVLHACYRGDRQATTVSAAMLAYHRATGTWSNNIDAYVALSEFNRSLFCRAGLAEESIFVKPNFLKSDPGPGTRKRAGALFVGRLIPEKGISTLLTAWKRIGWKLPLTIFGDGPLRDEVASAAQSSDGAIRWLGWRSRREVDEALGAASVVISPSVWIEAGPLSVIESFARGTPVIASRLGSLAEFVKPDVSGYLFDPGNPASLVEAVEKFLNLPDCGSRMRETARTIFLDTYSAEPAYNNMLALYDFALKNFEASKTRR
jgi:glycosyltransferase involved in cell wall biosynthesis